MELSSSLRESSEGREVKVSVHEVINGFTEKERTKGLVMNEH